MEWIQITRNSVKRTCSNSPLFTSSFCDQKHMICRPSEHRKGISSFTDQTGRGRIQVVWIALVECLFVSFLFLGLVLIAVHRKSFWICKSLAVYCRIFFSLSAPFIFSPLVLFLHWEKEYLTDASGSFALRLVLVFLVSNGLYCTLHRCKSLVLFSLFRTGSAFWGLYVKYFRFMMLDFTLFCFHTWKHYFCTMSLREC